MFNRSYGLMCQHKSQEELRQQEVDRERGMQASLQDQERFERRRYLRQVQEELKERQTESALLRVGFSVVQVAALS